MESRRVILLVVLGLGSIIGLAGCSGPGSTSSPPPPPPPNGVLFVSAPPKSLAVKASATLVAAATFPIGSTGGNSQVTWSLTCASAGACGSFSPNDDASGITYTAPAAIPSGGTVTVTATSVADTTKSISATITIVAPIPISVSFYAPPPASLQVNSSFTMSASISNDVSANPQVKWTVTCGASACGSFSSTTSGNESQNTYTAPAAIPPGGSVTVTVTSVTDPTKSASTSIVITAATPTLANGTYVFQISGLTGFQASFMTGVFTASNGTITGGEQDWVYYVSNDDGSPYGYSQFQQIGGGSYATTPDGNVQVSLQAGAGQVETLTGALTAGQQGFVASINGSPATATLTLQTSTAAPSGGYAVSLSGGDEFTDPIWIGGVLNIDSVGGISGAGSVLDVIGGQVDYAGTQTLGASTITPPDATGRVQIQLLPGANSALPPISLAGYIIDATHMQLIEITTPGGSQYSTGVLGGAALGQGASTGHFSTTTIAGSSYVFGAQGSDTHGSLQMAGVFTPKADGTLSGTLNRNDLTGSTSQSPVPVTGTYTVDPTGRVTISSLSDGSTFNDSLHLYLGGSGNGFLLSNDSGEIFDGQIFQQQTGTFSAASFSGSYGLNATLIAPGTSAFGITAATGSITSTAGSGSNTVAGYADTGGSTADFAVTGSFTPSANGVFQGTLSGFDPAARATANTFTLYLVDSTQGVMIETDPTQLTLGHLQNLQ